MKFIPLLTLLIFSTLSTAQSEQVLKSDIDKVTVYTQGAQVNRAATVNLRQGENIIVFEKLSPVLDENSLQFGGQGDYSVLALNYEIRYDENEQKEKMASMNAELKRLSDQVKNRKDLLAVSVSEENVLVSNTDFDIWEGMSVEQLKQGVDFVRDRLIQIKKRKQDLRAEIDQLNTERQKLINEIQETRIKEAQPNAVVAVKIQSEREQRLEASLTYVVADASWEAYYDLRVEDITSPLEIDYRANVRQNTGEDWDKVMLTLSTGNPYDDGQLPRLNPWYINYSGNRYSRSVAPAPTPQRSGITGLISGSVTDASTSEALAYANVVVKDQYGQLVAGTTTDIDGRFNLDTKSPVTRLEVSFLGYNLYATSLSQSQFYSIKLTEAAEQLDEVVIAYEPPRVQKSAETQRWYTSNTERIQNMPSSIRMEDMAVMDVQTIGAESTSGGSSSTGQFRISQNPITLKFDVDLPYDIPSDGSNYKVGIKTYNREVEYLYQAVPKLNENAFLTASLTGWEELNLLDGKAGIYYEGNYLGETTLKVSQASDTLQISMGKDKNVVVRRRTIQETSSKKLLSGKVEELFHYQIKVRNNKPAPIRLQITDQFPVSGNSEIAVEREETSEGKVDDKSGLINWDFTLEPSVEKELDLIYKVRYPKKRTVNLY
jgi:hypothetical protein